MRGAERKSPARSGAGDHCGGGSLETYSAFSAKTQPRRGFLGGSAAIVRDTQRLLETCPLDLDPVAIREGIRFAESLVEAIGRWRHLQARRLEGVR